MKLHQRIRRVALNRRRLETGLIVPLSMVVLIVTRLMPLRLKRLHPLVANQVAQATIQVAPPAHLRATHLARVLPLKARLVITTVEVVLQPQFLRSVQHLAQLQPPNLPSLHRQPL